MKRKFTLLLCVLLCSVTGSFAQNALNFPDANDYGKVPFNAAFELTGDFTIEAWIKTTGSGYQTVIATDSLNASGHLGYWFGLTPAGYVGIQLFDGDFSWSTITGTTNVNDGNWHHIAASCDQTNLYIIVDGVQEGTGAYYNPVYGSHALDVGVDQEGNYITGAIDDLRIWTKTLSAAEIAAAKDTCLTGTEDSLAVYFKFDEASGATFADAGPASLTGTLTNMTDNDWVAGQVVCPTPPPSGGPSALRFDGTDDYIEINPALEDAFDFTGEYTVEAWIKVDQAQPSGLGTIISNVDAAVTAGTYFAVVGTAIGYETDGGGNVSSTVGTINIVDGNCHHVALVVASDSTRMYVDGVQDGLAQATVQPGANSEPMWIGRNNGQDHYFRGDMSQLRFWNVAKSQAEIAASMNTSYVGSTDNDLVAFYEFDGAAGQTTLNDQRDSGNQHGTLMNMDVNTAWVPDSCVQSSVSVEEIDQMEDVVVYPNPTAGKVEVALYGVKNVAVNVYSMTGRLIHSEDNINTTTYELTLEGESGVYYVIVSSNGENKPFKVIKL